MILSAMARSVRFLSRKIILILLFGMLGGIFSAFTISEELLARPEKHSEVFLEAISDSSEFRILTYNLYMRTPNLFFWNKQKRRTELLPAVLGGFDILILEEVFHDKYREQLVEELTEAYPFVSEMLGEDSGLKQDGGVIMLSRWPIVAQDQILYGDACAGADCLATKGAIYLQINKQGRMVHVAGTHTQASVEHRPVRAQQFKILSDWLAQKDIPITEPLFISGDLNVDKFSGSETGEYQDMLSILAASLPGSQTGTEHEASYSPDNQFVKQSEGEYLDYVLVSNSHLQPLSAYNRVWKWQADGLDLSDHYAVEGVFVFGE